MESISELAKSHHELVGKLRQFSFVPAAHMLAALSLCPELHSSTTRIEVLQHLAAVSCRGDARPKRQNLIEWATKLMAKSPVVSWEDPAEDVFIDYVNSAFGGFRVLSSNFSNAALWIERLLAFLVDKQDFPPFQSTVSQVLSLLRVSEALADRAGLVRYCEGGTTMWEKIQVPEWATLSTYLRATRFSAEDLMQLGIDHVGLGAFTLTADNKAKLLSERLWNSSMERFPLIAAEDGVIVIAPSSLGRAVVRYLLEQITRGIGGWADTFFQTECASIFVNEVGKRLEIEPLNFERPPWPDGLPPMFPYFGCFDFGKPVIMLTHCLELTKAAADFNGVDEFTKDDEAKLKTFLRSCASEFEKASGFSGGLVLISFVNVGLSCVFSLTKEIPNWRIHVAPLPDWLTLTDASDCTAMRLWKLSEHETIVESMGTRTLNLSGLLNLYTYWKENGFRLVPKKSDPRSLTLLHVNCDFAARCRANTKRRKDKHCVLAHDGKSWVTLTRRNTESLFQDEAPIRRYADYAAARQGRLLACIMHERRRWWVISPGRHEKAEIASLIFKLWECVEEWIARIAPVLAQEWPEVSASSVEIRLDLPNVANWDLTAGRCLPSEPDDLSISVDSETLSVTLTMREGFLKMFSTPKNIAEQRIVLVLLKALGILFNRPTDDTQREGVLSKIVPNDDARFFHIVTVNSIEQMLAKGDRPEPHFVREEDYSLAQQGIVDLVGRPANGNKIVGLGPCSDFLQKAVDKVWERLEARLKPFDRVSVAMKCFEALGEISRDEEHWDMTTRSQLALHSDAENVHEVLLERRADRAKASVCNRLIIETAQYACISEGGHIFTEADHLTILADMEFLIVLANHRDAITFGFMEPKLDIFPNGELGVDETFYANVLSKYFSKIGYAASERAQADYESYFPELEEPPQTEVEEIEAAVDQFDKVFAPEFGFSVRKLFEVRDQFRELALATKIPSGGLSEEIIQRLLSLSGMTALESQAFLECFTLPIRGAWDKDLPPRCHRYDVYPWRHRRQLSLLSRPLVQAAISPRKWIISLPVFERCIKYWLWALETARFPKEFFQSIEMQKYVGNQANKRGHEFARQVADTFASSGYSAKLECEMTQLGAPKKLGLGDIDVLAWQATSGKVYASECKRLLPAQSVREVVQRLEDFRGSKEEKDSLGRHTRRIEWLEANLSAVSKFVQIPQDKIRLIPLLVTSEIVPMQFYAAMNFPTSQVITHGELAENLKAINS